MLREIYSLIKVGFFDPAGDNTICRSDEIASETIFATNLRDYDFKIFPIFHLFNLYISFIHLFLYTALIYSVSRSS